MSVQKEFNEIAWDVPEQVYRDDHALSYSTLSTYERSGFDGLAHLFDKKESPSLLLGSVVDSILTGGEEEFNNRYMVLYVSLTDSGKDICDKLISMNLQYETFEEIPHEVVSNAAKEVGFWKGDKWDGIRYREVLKTGDVAGYYDAMRQTDKTVIDSDTYNDALKMVDALRESPATSMYFADDDLFSSIKRYYQLKFKFSNDGVNYRSMADLIIVDYEKKIVYPVDLKTSGKPEWHFEESFLQWMYPIQARLYWRNIRANMDNDPFFKDFELANYRFIVVNRNTLIPLVWEFPHTKTFGTLVDEQGNKFRDPFEIGAELKSYLDLKPTVPNGIVLRGVNVINCLKEQEETEN